MSLSIGTCTSLLQANMSGYSYNGLHRDEFVTAVATGFVNTTISLTGIIAGPANSGPSTGVGITVSGASIKATIRSTAISLFGQEGTALLNVSDAIGQAVATHLLAATLVSDGNGASLFSSFSSAISTMASAIQAATTFNGPQWAHFCTAIATGICQNVGSSGTATLAGAVGGSTGTGIVTIS